MAEWAKYSGSLAKINPVGGDASVGVQNLNKAEAKSLEIS